MKRSRSPGVSRLAAPQFARARLLQRAAARGTRRKPRGQRANDAARPSARRVAGRRGRAGQKSGRPRRRTSASRAMPAPMRFLPQSPPPLRPRRLGPPCRRTSARRSCAAPPTGSKTSTTSSSASSCARRKYARRAGSRCGARGGRFPSAITPPRRSASRPRLARAARRRRHPSVRGTSPLAIFTGQIAAALAAGNAVIAKPAEETPLIAAEAVRVLHEAGVPREALALLPGAGEVERRSSTICACKASSSPARRRSRG